MDIYNFVDFIPEVVDFIKNYFNMTDTIEKFCTAFYKWKYIYCFIDRTKKLYTDD